jgi:hypothetical protein
MTVADDGASRYRIVVRGECGKLLAGVIGALAIECRQGRTTAVAVVRDEAEFYGLLYLFQELALHIVSIEELDQVRSA